VITLICPTKNRPDLCKRMVESAYATADGKIGIILGIAEPSIYYADYENIKGPDKIPAGALPTVATINLIAKRLIEEGTTTLFFVVGDDAVFKTKGWDTALLKAYSELENKIHVFGLQDSRDKEGTPHPIATKEFIQAMGYLLVPIFNHWYADTWLSDLTKANNCFTYLRDYVLEHKKPSDEGVFDSTYKDLRGSGTMERDKFVSEACAHFLGIEKGRLRDARTNRLLTGWRS